MVPVRSGVVNIQVSSSSIADAKTFCIMTTQLTHCSFLNFTEEMISSSDCRTMSANITAVEQKAPFILVQDSNGSTLRISFDTRFDTVSKPKVWIAQAMELPMSDKQTFTVDEPGKYNP